MITERSVARGLGYHNDRRGAMRLLAGSAMAFGAAGMYAPETRADACVTANPPNPEILIIDFSPPYCDPNIAQRWQESNAKLISRLMINSQPVDQIKGPLGFLLNHTGRVGSAGKWAREQVTDRVSFLDPVAKEIDEWQGHGRLVGHVIRNVLLSKGHDVTPMLHPIQPLYENIQEDEDELGNPILYAEMDVEDLNGAIAQYDANIVNFSWEPVVGIKSVYRFRDANGNEQFNPIPDIVLLDGFRVETAATNVPKIISVAQAFPGKTISVAAGNIEAMPGIVLDPMIERGELPDNFIMSGEYFPGEWEVITDDLRVPRLNAIGATSYVDSLNSVYNPDRRPGSTYSTAINTGHLADHLFSGVSAPRDQIAAMRRASDEIPVHVPNYSGDGYRETNLVVFDPARHTTRKSHSRRFFPAA